MHSATRTTISTTTAATFRFKYGFFPVSDHAVPNLQIKLFKLVVYQQSK